MPKVLITTVPFGHKNRLPIELLEAAGIEYLINPIGRKLQESELAELVSDFEVIIAGTEQISANVMACAKNLKLISRVGVGLDSIDLMAARDNGIQVSYTPEAPAPAVAELTIGLMLSLLRSVHLANTQLHRGEWERHFGRRISEVSFGIVGAGRIGGRVLQHLKSLGAKHILVNDILSGNHFPAELKLELVDKETLYRESDVITLHLPLTKNTLNMISSEQLLQMKHDAILINTARGGIVNEGDLASVLKTGHLSGAAVDVFLQEPYAGELASIDRCLLTSHMGSMSVDCRASMELEATREAIRYFEGEMLQGVVPQEEYNLRLQEV